MKITCGRHVKYCLLTDVFGVGDLQTFAEVRAVQPRRRLSQRQQWQCFEIAHAARGHGSGTFTTGHRLFRQILRDVVADDDDPKFTVICLNTRDPGINDALQWEVCGERCTFELSSSVASTSAGSKGKPGKQPYKQADQPTTTNFATGFILEFNPVGPAPAPGAHDDYDGDDGDRGDAEEFGAEGELECQPEPLNDEDAIQNFDLDIQPVGEGDIHEAGEAPGEDHHACGIVDFSQWISAKSECFVVA